jgi:acyl-CoA synthetase (NDP forming)
VEPLLRSPGGVLVADAALALCAAFGIPAADGIVAETAPGALAAAGALGYPVALKALSPDVPHKSDVGGVALNVDGPDVLRAEYAALVARVGERNPHARLAGVLVQRMLSGGREVILGGRRDSSFGPVVMCGLGGVHAEALGDVVLRLAPLDREEAGRMIADLRGAGLLRGVRGEPAADVQAVVDSLLALSRLLVCCPEVTEIDVNPLLVFDRGAMAVDARALIGQNTT